jgi:hypothetical protein
MRTPPTYSKTGILRSWPVAACVLSGLLGSPAAQAYLVPITAGTRALYLQVGAGSMTGGDGTYAGGATPGNNGNINLVSTIVAAATVGNGTSQNMSTNSTVAASPWEGFTFCIPANGQVYVGGFYRTPGTGANGTLSVSTPSNLVNANSNTLPFGTISWVSSGLGDPVTTIPSGTFVGGSTQTLMSLVRNNWFESCFAFRYNNAQMAAAGTYSGRATYTLSAP